MKEKNEKKRSLKVSELELLTKIIKIKRVTKVMKGGRVMSFSALVVVGDPEKNLVGVGFGKALEGNLAVDKATNAARKNFMRVPVFRGTIPHDVHVKYKSTHISLKRSPEGKGVIAGGATRVILEVAGVSNILGKIRGSNTPYNVVMATIKALKELQTPYSVAKRRGISIEKVFNG